MLTITSNAYARNGSSPHPSIAPRSRPDEATERLGSSLSRRETEVLRWLALGKSGPEIGIILGISTCTVRIHIHHIKRKLDAVNLPHAIYVAFACGLLRPEGGDGARHDT